MGKAIVRPAPTFSPGRRRLEQGLLWAATAGTWVGQTYSSRREVPLQSSPYSRDRTSIDDAIRIVWGTTQS
jgi:hypothetical protein